MNKLSKSVKILISLLMILSITASAKSSKDAQLNKASIHSPGQFDVNNIDSDMENNGMIVSHRISGHSGLEWPKGSGHYAVYATGPWIAGKVNGEIRTVVAEYESEWTSGLWGSDGSDTTDILYKINAKDLVNPTDAVANWPVTKGAPWVDKDGDGIYNPIPNGPDYPDIRGDQMIYYVMNDGIADDHHVFSTESLGLEVRMSIWGWDKSDVRADIMFVKAQIYNRGGNEIEDAYFGVWSDPDLGSASDDWVGCDTSLSLGFCYNDGADSQYGEASPAVGIDYLQMAVPSDNPLDEQYCFDELKQGYRNMPLTSFIKYIGGDAVYTDPNDRIEAYNYLRGYRRDGTPFINSATGEPTKFVCPDDPNLDTGGNDLIWVDGDDNKSDDRRMLMGSGPFDFAAGDSAEMIFAVFLSQGTTSLNSVTRLKEVSEQVQTIYDLRLHSPEPPPKPILTAYPSRASIILEWDNLAEQSRVLEPFSNDYYNFQGYNIYQLDNIHGTGLSEKIATFDIIDGITLIKDYHYFEDYGVKVYMPVQDANDSGIQHSMEITTDALNGGSPLIDNRLYYFGVSAYSYGANTDPHFHESEKAIIQIRPQGNVYQHPDVERGEQFDVTHNWSVVKSDGRVRVIVGNPSKITGHDYEVFFDTLSFIGENQPTFMWGLRDVTLDAVVLSDQTIQTGVDMVTGVELGYVAAPVVDGLSVWVDGSSVGFHGVFLVQAGAVDRSFAHDDVNYSLRMGDVWNYGWNDDDLFAAITFPADDPVVPNGRYWVTQGGGQSADNRSYEDSLLRGDNADYAIPDDFEWRWLGVGDSSWAIWHGLNTPVGAVKVPYEIWNIGKGTPENTSDDVQMIPRIYDIDGNGKYNWQGDAKDSGGRDDAFTDWVYWWSLADGKTWSDFETASEQNEVSAMEACLGHEVMANSTFLNHNGEGGHPDTMSNSGLEGSGPSSWTAADTAIFLERNWFLDPVNTNAVVDSISGAAVGFVLPFPSPGSVYRWITNKPNSPEDTFTFSTAGFEPEQVAFHTDSIKVWPNPYFAYNPEEVLLSDNQIHFINLPDKATISIYSLAGQLVRRFEHSGGQNAIWDIRNFESQRVASGVYIAVVSTDFGNKILKIAVVMRKG